MKITPLLIALVLALSACGSEGSSTASDPAPTSAAMPAAVPAPVGEVRTRDLATVMDTGTPELCLGPVAESYPPQCGGPEIANWDWDTHGQGMFEQQGRTRWGTFALTGRWDGTTFEVTEAVPGPLYDPMVPEPSDSTGRTAYSDAELEQIAEDLRALPGYLGGYATEGHVLVDVTFDDGSLQFWADEQYGDYVVLVTSMLVPVE